MSAEQVVQEIERQQVFEATKAAAAANRPLTFIGYYGGVHKLGEFQYHVLPA